MEIEVREAVDADRETVVGLALKLSEFNRGRHRPECRYDDYGTVKKALREHTEAVFGGRDENTRFLLACREGKPVGYALVRIYREPPFFDSGTGLSGLLDDLYVEESARGAGAGRRLMDEALAWLRRRGIRRVKLHAFAWNESARKLYENYGFREFAVSYEKFL